MTADFLFGMLEVLEGAHHQLQLGEISPQAYKAFAKSMLKEQ